MKKKRWGDEWVEEGELLGLLAAAAAAVLRRSGVDEKRTFGPLRVLQMVVVWSPSRRRAFRPKDLM